MTGSMQPAPLSAKDAIFRVISGHKWLSSLLLIAVVTYPHSQAAGLAGHISITTTSLPPTTVQHPYDAVLSVNGGTSPYQFKVRQGVLPPGLVLNSSTGAITGTPTATGTYYFKVFVTDLPLTDDGDRRFNITVSGSNPSNSSLTVTISPSSASVISGVSQQFNASVSGTSQTAVTWSASGGTVSASGLFTAPSVNAATTVTVTATSVAAPAQSASAAVSVNPITQPAGLAISTTALPPDTSGLTYQGNLYATGGTPPYRWSVISGALPAGFTLGSTGTISGTSTVIGLYNFTVQVQDSVLHTASAALSLLVTTATSCGPPTYNCSRNDLIPAPNPAVPPQVGPNTCSAGSLNTCGNLTGANTIVTDPDFGNRIVRATDSTSGCGGTCIVSNSGANGAQMWNNNSTFFVTGTTGGGDILFSFNPSTLHAARLNSLPGGTGYIWSWLNPSILYGINRTVISKYDLTGYTGGTLPTPAVVFDFNSAGCLQADPNWNANPAVTWRGQFQSSKDDLNFATPLSNAGVQGTGTFAVVYTVGKGCRVLDTKSGVIYGQWGVTGTISIPDRWTIHANAIGKGGDWDGVGFNNCLSATCSGTSSGYFWRVATTFLDFPTGCVGGHETLGYTSRINNSGCNHYGQDSMRTFANPGSAINLLANFPSGMVTPFDQHIAWQNDDPSDSYPFISSTWTNIFPLPAAWYNEVIATYPSSSLGIPMGTVKRFAHSFITGKNQRFDTEYAIGHVSPDGRFFMYASDWLGTLGSEGGAASCTIGADCRGDVYIVELK